MGYISFYRKWRPQAFDEVIGQKYNIQTLKNVLAGKRLSHSYMFCGPRGTGKTSTARILAKAINCVDGITPVPCNKCRNCTSISNGSNVDVIEIDAASNRGINEIRELREKVKYLPNNLRKKVYIIDEVHMLTTEAFNALLKVLEEPPEHVIFIMATTEPNKVLPTIMSRCQRFDFYPISLDIIKKRLGTIAKSEKLSISNQALGLIAKYADGSLRDADGILEQLAAYNDGKIEPKDIVALLGVVDLEVLFKFVDVLAEGNISRGLEMIKSIIGSNQNLKVFVSELLDHLYNIYVVKNYGKPTEVTDISKDYVGKYIKQAESLHKEEIEYYLDHFTELLKQIKWGESSKTFFRAAAIQAITYIVLDDKQIDKKIRAWEAKIHSLEREVKDTGVLFEESGQVATPPQDSEDLDFLNAAKPESTIKDASTIKNESTIKDESTIKQELDGLAKEPVKEIKKSSAKSGELESVTGSLDRILELLKRKKISVHAMFVEAEPDRIDGKTLYFCLDENKKWHKDHLNKAANSNLISEVIGEIIGEKYQVKFESGKVNMKNQTKNHTGQSSSPVHDDLNKEPGTDEIVPPDDRSGQENTGKGKDPDKSKNTAKAVSAPEKNENRIEQKKDSKKQNADIGPEAVQEGGKNVPAKKVGGGGNVKDNKDTGTRKDSDTGTRKDSDTGTRKDSDTGMDKDDSEDMLKYFEKKFDIKE